uniref:Uncharacterized protein n=1 Tax=Picea glauca TaxID=3330 RepID=A0A117NHP8_PICGL|nr:hypothetical protein ABT39_MTgene4742 [Picea glauca]
MAGFVSDIQIWSTGFARKNLLLLSLSCDTFGTVTSPLATSNKSSLEKGYLLLLLVDVSINT